MNINKEWIYENFVTLNKSYKDISIETNLKNSQICYLIKKFNIKKYHKFSSEEDKILKENFGNISLKEISKILNNKYDIGKLKRRADKLNITSDIDKLQQNKCLSMRDYDLNDNYFEVPNESNCYWAGFMAADFNVQGKQKNKNKTYKSSSIRVELSNKDYNHLVKFKNEISFNGKIREFYKKDSKSWHCALAFSSWKSKVDLERNFNIIPAKTLILKPPKIEKENLVKSFIIGNLDGDGTLCFVNNDGYQVLSFILRGTEDLMKWSKQWIDKWCPEIYHTRIKNPKYIYKKGNMYEFPVQGKRAENIVKCLSEVSVPRLSRKWGII